MLEFAHEFSCLLVLKSGLFLFVEKHVVNMMQTSSQKRNAVIGLR